MYGWRYIVVDIPWSEQHPQSRGHREDADLAMDEYGRLIPAIMRGIPRKAVKADVPVAGGNARAAGIANVHSACPWNSDMYEVRCE